MKEARKGLVRNTKFQTYVMVYALSRSSRSYWCLKLEHRDEKNSIKNIENLESGVHYLQLLDLF